MYAKFRNFPLGINKALRHFSNRGNNKNEKKKKKKKKKKNRVAIRDAFQRLKNYFKWLDLLLESTF